MLGTLYSTFGDPLAQDISASETEVGDRAPFVLLEEHGEAVARYRRRAWGRDAVVEARWNDEGEVDVAEVED